MGGSGGGHDMGGSEGGRDLESWCHDLEIPMWA